MFPLSINLVTSELLRNIDCHQHMGEAALLFPKMFCLARVGAFLQQGNPKLHKHTESPFVSIFIFIVVAAVVFPNLNDEWCIRTGGNAHVEW